MAIHVRMAAEYNRAFYLGIERIEDNAQFNFATGAFETAASPMLVYPFTQDPKTPGRYTIEAPHQKLLQFNGSEFCFWLFRSNGQQPGQNNLETVWLESGTATLPFTLDDFLVINITEPTADF
jgi:hypothetical protein